MSDEGLISSRRDAEGAEICGVAGGSLSNDALAEGAGAGSENDACGAGRGPSSAISASLRENEFYLGPPHLFGDQRAPAFSFGTYDGIRPFLVFHADGSIDVNIDDPDEAAQKFIAALRDQWGVAADGLAATECADVLALLERRRDNARTVAKNTPESDEMHGLAHDRARQLQVLIDEIRGGHHEGAAAVAAELAKAKGVQP